MPTLDPQHAYAEASKRIAHFQRLLAGDGLTERDKYRARLSIIHYVGVMVRARQVMEQSKELAHQDAVNV